MDANNPRQDRQDREPENPQEPFEDKDRTKAADSGQETVNETVPPEAMVPELPETPETFDEPAGPDEKEIEATVDDEEMSDLVAELPAAGATFEQADVPISPPPVTTESTPMSVLPGGDAADGETPTAASSDRPYFGPIQNLNDLPQYILGELDEELAAKLQAAIEHPEQFAPGFLDHTSIQSQLASFPRATPPGGDDETPWYDSALPPLRLEVSLLKYDRMVETVIDRASRRIDRNTHGMMDSKINEVLFQLRSEIRALSR